MGPFRARWTRSSAVKSRNRRCGSGGWSIWPGWELLGGALLPTARLDLSNACVRHAVRASHNPPAASSATIARNSGFLFMVFHPLIHVSASLSPRHCARISGGWRSIWNEGGEFWCEAPAKGNEPGSRIVGASRKGSESRRGLTDGHRGRNRVGRDLTLGGLETAWWRRRSHRWGVGRPTGARPDRLSPCLAAKGKEISGLPEFQLLLDFSDRTRGGIALAVLQDDQILALKHGLKLLNLVQVDDHRAADAQEALRREMGFQ